MITLVFILLLLIKKLKQGVFNKRTNSLREVVKTKLTVLILENFRFNRKQKKNHVDVFYLLLS